MAAREQDHDHGVGAVASARERAMEALRNAYVDGSIDVRELNERTDAVYGAASVDALAAVIKDLPNGAWLGAARAESLLAPHLLPDERLLWAGTPSAPRFRWADIGWLVFGTLWMASVLTTAIGALVDGANPARYIVVLPFTAFGLYAVAGRRWLAARSRRRTVFGVTSRRVVTLYHGRRETAVDTASLKSLGAIRTTIRRDGRGDLTFTGVVGRPTYSTNVRFDRSRGIVAADEMRFQDIEDVAAVAALVDRAREAARAA